MGDSGNFNWFLSKRRDRETLRKSLKVVSGGKEVMPPFDNRALHEDSFLRSHYLERKKDDGPSQPLLSGYEDNDFR